MSGAKDRFPILLANGNRVAAGDNGDGTHWAQWHDPWPKPCYLFALVAGDLVANSSTFTTCGGRKVALNVWVRPEDLPRTGHAIESLSKARSEEHTSELQSLMRISYAVFCLKKKNHNYKLQ